MAHPVLDQLLGELLHANGQGTDKQQTAKVVARACRDNQRTRRQRGTATAVKD